MTIFRWRCWLRFVWYAVVTDTPSLSGPFVGAFVSGHRMADTTDERGGPARCEDCGAWSKGWKRT